MKKTIWLISILLIITSIARTASGSCVPQSPINKVVREQSAVGDEPNQAQAPSPQNPEPNQPTANATPAISSRLNQLLDRIEQTAVDLKTFQADMLYNQRDTLVDTLISRSGKIYYRTSGEKIDFRIHFADFKQQDLEDETPAETIKFDEDFVFDGRWLTARNERTKSIRRIEVSKNPANKESFRLGKGPFPLPFAIKKADVLREFNVKLIGCEEEKEEKEKTLCLAQESFHLELTPKADSSYAKEYQKLDLWFAQKTAAAYKVRFVKEGYEITTVEWQKIKLNQQISDKVFQLAPARAGWSEEITPLEEPASGGEESPPAGQKP